jgi:hypothetical protein
VVLGWTNSSDIPLANPFDATIDGATDAFVTKLQF